MKEIIVAGQTIQLNPIAFTIGGIPIYWYAIFIVASIALALFVYYKKDGTFGVHYEDILDLCLFLLPICVMGARLYYILFHLESYSSLADMLRIKDGGLAIYGGILAGILTTYLFCKKKKMVFLDVLDYMVPCLALRPSHWKMGKLCECRSLWKHYRFAMENGSSNTQWNYICASNIFI